MIRERIREKLHEKKVMKVLHLKNKKKDRQYKKFMLIKRFQEDDDGPVKAPEGDKSSDSDQVQRPLYEAVGGRERTVDPRGLLQARGEQGRTSFRCHRKH
jgi:hypothetical protein